VVTRFELIVDRKLRLEDFLLEQFQVHSKMYLRGLVKDEQCEVNGRPENIGYRLRPHDFVEISVEEDRGTAMRPEDISFDIVFEDEHLIVVNKPAGMLMHPSHREHSGTLLNGLVFHLNDKSGGRPTMDSGERIRPGLIHRLDKETSGLVVVAKDARAHRILSGHFMKRRIEKRYLALVEGVLADDEGTIRAPIGRYDELKFWGVKADGKDSETQFVVRERRSDTTLVELEPVTGRTNQLRIHCQSIGHPIVGDVPRGGRKFSRLCLHAYRLGFPHPATNNYVEFETPNAGLSLYSTSDSVPI
jgi:23S rRNA pseudouridine1911/1915/1917 synthase